VGEDSYHKTQTSILFRGTTWVPSGFRFSLLDLRHHRLILDTIGKKLEAFSSSREMVGAIRAALVGMNVRVMFSFSEC
jgi:hypothetical protein